MLLKKDVATDTTRRDGNTALMLALQFDKLKNVQLLLKAQANQALRNNKGLTASQIAEQKGVACLFLFNTWSFIVYNPLHSLSYKVEMLYCSWKLFPQHRFLLVSHSIEFLFEEALNQCDE